MMSVKSRISYNILKPWLPYDIGLAISGLEFEILCMTWQSYVTICNDVFHYVPFYSSVFFGSLDATSFFASFFFSFQIVLGFLMFLFFFAPSRNGLSFCLPNISDMFHIVSYCLTSSAVSEWLIVVHACSGMFMLHYASSFQVMPCYAQMSQITKKFREIASPRNGLP